MNKILLLILTCISVNVYSQLLPPFQSEQNPCGALEICGTFYTPYSYQGIGTTSDLTNTPCGSSFLPCGEDNVVWFKLNIVSSGTLVFRIIPSVISDDYDWALLDGTGKTCATIGYTDVIRCNFNTNDPIMMSGQTGLNMSSLLTNVAGGTVGNNFCKYVDVIEGEVYYLMVNNFGAGGSPTSGFFLNFEGSTATFNVPPEPHLESIISSPCSHSNFVRVKLDRSIKCNSIALDGSDFELLPSGAITSAIGIDCGSTVNGFTDEIQINFATPLPPGHYTLRAKVGSDGNTLLNLCDIPLPLPDELEFDVYKLIDTVVMDNCENAFPLVWNGITITGGGIAGPYVRPNVVGCDSSTYLMVNVVDTIITVEDITICSNQLPYTWNGIVLTSGGDTAATQYYLTFRGCDSLSILNLTVTPPKVALENLVLCSYQLPYIWNGKTIPVDATSSPSYDTFKTTTITGCDSFTILNLTVHHIIPELQISDTHACGFFEYKGNTYYSNTVLNDTVLATTGCDSIYWQLNVFVHSNEPVLYHEEYKACDSIVFRGQKFYNDTTIIDTFRSVYDCDSALHLHHLMIQHFELELNTDTITIVDGERLILKTSANVPYEMVAWMPTHYFSNQSLYEQYIFPKETNTFIAIAESNYGCLDTARMYVEVVPLVPDWLMPNAFSPNGDGLNDEFMPIFFHETGYTIKHFDIYDRWGNLVYKLENSYVKGWNGKYSYKDEYATAGVYYYYIEVQFVNGQVVSKKGDVTLIR